MVGPISAEQRASQLFRLKLGVALLVGISAGLVALQGRASPPVIGVSVVAGTVLGGALSWYVFPAADQYRDADDGPSYRR